MTTTAVRRADPYLDTQVIDARAPRFNQAVVAVGATAAVLTGFWPLLLLLGVQLAVGLVFGRRYCLPCRFYFSVLQPRFGEGPLEDSRAPRFANIVGAGCLLTASAAWAAGGVTLGRALGALVAALAALALVTGLCVGCELYRLLARLRGLRPQPFTRVDLRQLGVPEEQDGEVVVLFSHPLCSECQEVGPRLSAQGRRVVTVDVSQRRDLAERYGVTLVPLAVAVAPDGRVLERLVSA